MTDAYNSYTEPSPFTIITNVLIRSPSLSCKAFKLLCIGLSHSGSWRFNKNQILTCFKEGEHTLDAAMKELRATGHLHIVARSNGSRFDGHHWFWFKDPLTEVEFKKFYRKGGFHRLRISPTPNTTPAEEEQYQEEQYQEDKTDTTTYIPESPVEAVSKDDRSSKVFDSLSSLDIPQDELPSLVARILSEGRDAAVLVDRVLKWTNKRVNDAAAALSVLNRWDKWDIQKKDSCDSSTVSVNSEAVPERRSRAALLKDQLLAAGCKIIDAGIVVNAESGNPTYLDYSNDRFYEFLRYFEKEKS